MIKHIKNILKIKDQLFGTWSIIASPIVVDIIGTTGLDFIIIDMEHGDVSINQLGDLYRAANNRGFEAIVRLPDNNKQTILRVLETGIRSIMIPHVSSKEEAIEIVKNCKYYPEGNKGLSPYTINHDYTHKNIPNSLRNANDEIFIGVLIEGKDCIKNAKEISTVKGIDLIYMGIYDISQELGLPGDLYHPQILKIIKECVDIIQKNGKFAGSFAMDKKYINILKECNFKFISYSVDCAILKEGYENI